jgi:hypothetical protein
MGNTTLLAISTLTSEINFYTRLMKMRDRLTGMPIFTFLSVELACAACKAEGRASECVHMLHLVPRFVRPPPRAALAFSRIPPWRRHAPAGVALAVIDCESHRARHRWQSADRHVKLKTIMQDRPDLIESELSGLAFDSLQQVFKPDHIDSMFKQPLPPPVINEDVHVFIDPAAGGPYSDYAIVSVTRQKGMITVSRASGQAPHARALHHGWAAEKGVEHFGRPGRQLIKYAMRTRSTNSEELIVSSLIHVGIRVSCSSA